MTATKTCACAGCTNTFQLSQHAMHRLYCSKRCRDMAARIEFGRRPEPEPAARKLCDATGGIRPDGSVVSGTLTLTRREVVDVRETPQDDARFW